MLLAATDEEQAERRAASGGFREPGRARVSSRPAPAAPPAAPTVLLCTRSGFCLEEHEYVIHTKEQVIVYELPAFPLMSYFHKKTQFHFSSNLITS